MTRLQTVLLKLLLKTALESLDAIVQAAHCYSGASLRRDPIDWSHGKWSQEHRVASTPSLSSCQVLPLICKTANCAQPRINKNPIAQGQREDVPEGEL